MTFNLFTSIYVRGEDTFILGFSEIRVTRSSGGTLDTGFYNILTPATHTIERKRTFTDNVLSGDVIECTYNTPTNTHTYVYEVYVYYLYSPPGYTIESSHGTITFVS